MVLLATVTVLVITASKFIFSKKEHFSNGFVSSTTWWDPIANTCLCTTADCEVKSVAVTKTNTTSSTTNSTSVTPGDAVKDNDATQIAGLSTAIIAALFAGLSQFL